MSRPAFTDVPQPDELARAEARRRHATLLKPVESLGRLEELGAWIAACQGVCPPRPFQRPRVVIFAADHGIAAKGVSAYPQETTAQLVDALVKGTGVPNALAGVAGAGLRVVDVGVDADTAVQEFKVRRGSGSIDTEDALTEAEVEAALRAGVEIANAEVDAGADLLVAGDLGVGVSTPSAVLVAALTGTEPVAVVGRGSGIDDNAWMRKAAAIRDALRRARTVLADPLALLRTSAGADLAAMTGFLAQAAVRRTPVLLDGLTSVAAALVAEELVPNARAWWLAASRCAEPAHDLALEHLDLKPVLDLNIRLGEAAGALAALPLLTMAVRVLTDVATYEEAEVTAPSAP
ncbi:nicotinate-nucleotide--dimethylbenzimidazole phosphoribosyltransferase [Amycolatopsis bartoniae]|uniref:Nicotinate-nucleotide--dimethylbenzimidazole phosphoribosyltransferase n=1 Tax=Amycolatopsis bartoniae TaxID=941986 RepID=A0A8H9MFP9_9PSEU|nr:nicotinate-nucleotide--dimethylbenzimidazole phosphoribosyltransferase [Amycolatopsis bartoniae]MBB2934083.1 nicotinate-nucleotide--dimethylbenzimidazole phosphoribosyltransferase [Amycolatopsis bartoniae]TVT07372.1 nicotinate-nucleotide--dimethylbenzimidazole phosphoribosyltransferase [Amycolatopsis bartoniae]GHF84478.1 nicotinate-nucleotide--dimethylbenzimidazole phosphoribosyltransferase [Amycolatopsis bartoniae]